VRAAYGPVDFLGETTRFYRLGLDREEFVGELLEAFETFEQVRCLRHGGR
jgi:hypothetical protein